VRRTPPAALDRRAPTDWEHVEKHPVSAVLDEIKPSPVILGINWYSGFDDPQQDEEGRFWLPSSNIGSIRGGHCICVKSIQPDRLEWYRFYDQGEEGACVGFGVSRAQTMLNRVTYDAFWLYHEAQKMDEWPGEDYDGTSVRAGLAVAATLGLKRLPSGVVAPGDGISAYRWARSVEEVHATIQLPLADELGAVPLVNSWGAYYPHITWLPDSVLERLLGEDGEAAVITDR
jgi:hypothetical protein